MKRRTRVFAWVYAVLVSLGIVNSTTSIALLVIRPHNVRYGDAIWWMLVGLAVNILLMIGWTNLLDRRIWAWRLLILVLAADALARCLGAVTASYLLRDHLASFLLFLMLMYILPLSVLLTDRPSGWLQVANPQSEIPNPQ